MEPCLGTWQEVHSKPPFEVPFDLLKCDGCDCWWVILRPYRRANFSWMPDAPTAEEAVKQALEMYMIKLQQGEI